MSVDIMSSAYYLNEIIIFLFGLTVGSFLNVVGLRLLEEKSFIFPASHCPKCTTPIAFYDNIPVISYILLGGKCRACKAGIHWQYPIIELLTGILFLLTYLFFGFSIKTLFVLIFMSAMVVILITDFREKLIFDMTSLPLILVGLVYNFFNFGHIEGEFMIPLGLGELILPSAFISGILGIILGVAFFEGFSYLSYFTLGEHGFGGGDTKLAAGLGAFLGWKLLLLILVLSLFIQVIFALPPWLYQLYKSGNHKAFYNVIVAFTASCVPLVSTHLIANPIVNLVVLLIAMIIAIASIIMLLKGARDRQSFTFFPFGPSIVLAAILTIFWGQEIINVYLEYIS